MWVHLTSSIQHNEYTLVAQLAITNYIEKHFRKTLDKVSRPKIHKEHPVPNSPATKVPKVDGFINSQEQRCRVEICAVEGVCGPMACMWSELIDDDLLRDPDAA